MQRVAAASLAKAAWQPHHNLRGCFVGSGSEGLQQPEVCATIIDLTSKSPPDITVLYIVRHLRPRMVLSSKTNITSSPVLFPRRFFARERPRMISQSPNITRPCG